MGHPTDIFLKTPDDSIICSICFEVLEDPASFKECGHTFCAKCISACLLSANRTCPTCRKSAHTGSNPNYSLRDIIDKLEVKCPNSLLGSDTNSDCDSDNGSPPSKRLKTTGDTNEINDELNNNETGCNWKGTVGILSQHVGSDCLFATIECGEEGCKHSCQRRHMAEHKSSQRGLLMHMELKYQNKLKAMEMKYESMYQMMNDRIIHLEKKAVLCFNKHCSLPGREIKRGAMVCSRCGFALYCSPNCQRSDWRNHQAYCDRNAGWEDTREQSRRLSGNNNSGGNNAGAVAAAAVGRGGNVVGGGNTSRRSVVGVGGNTSRRRLALDAARVVRLNDAIFRAIRGQIETSGDSDTGASIVGIIASLEVEDYTEDEVRRAISLLINLGEVYSTIDENHYAIPGEERTVPRLPAAATAVATVAHAYGSVVNDAVIRLLRDAQSGEEGLSLADIVQGLTHSEVEVRVALDHLLYEGHIYTTIDDNHFQWSEYPSH